MTYGPGRDDEASWMLARPAFWAVIAVQLVAANQIWVAL